MLDGSANESFQETRLVLRCDRRREASPAARISLSVRVSLLERAEKKKCGSTASRLVFRDCSLSRSREQVDSRNVYAQVYT